MKEGLKDEPVTHGGVGLDPSHNDVGWDTNPWSSHIVGRHHSARKNDKKVFQDIPDPSSLRLGAAGDVPPFNVEETLLFLTCRLGMPQNPLTKGQSQ